jgi:hypothetical protein
MHKEHLTIIPRSEELHRVLDTRQRRGFVRGEFDSGDVTDKKTSMV